VSPSALDCLGGRLLLPLVPHGQDKPTRADGND
jgi:hypothetical protein